MASSCFSVIKYDVIKQTDFNQGWRKTKSFFSRGEYPACKLYVALFFKSLLCSLFWGKKENSTSMVKSKYQDFFGKSKNIQKITRLLFTRTPQSNFRQKSSLKIIKNKTHRFACASSPGFNSILSLHLEPRILTWRVVTGMRVTCKHSWDDECYMKLINDICYPELSQTEGRQYQLFYH